MKFVSKRYPVYLQPDSKDCGPTCLKMVSEYYDAIISIENLRELCETTREGSNLKFMILAAEKVGFKSLGVKLNFYTLKQEVNFPCIVHWKGNHFVVVYDISNQFVIVGDPLIGVVKYTHKEFLGNWVGEGADEFIDAPVMILDPTVKLNTIGDDTDAYNNIYVFLFQYVKRYKRDVGHLVIALFTGSLLQLIFPFLFQSIVDVGIQNNDINFITLILIGQVVLFVGNKSIELIRAWLLLHLSTKINIALISDFFIKLMNLPIAFFDAKMTGDILQRINDQDRIESFLTSSSLTAIFSFFNIIVFGGVLFWYNLYIFLIFFLGSLLYMLWVLGFLKKRRNLDYKKFSRLGSEQGKIIELINGMQEIKLHNAEKIKRWEWERLKLKIFKVELSSLKLEQVQTIGASFIQEIQNILITVLCARLVIEGSITLGMMLSISYIMGQLNAPIQQLIDFILSLQDATISIERLLEIHNKEDENDINSITQFRSNEDINLKGVSFRYKGSLKPVINNIDLVIPKGKVTAIVGTSGSGKTTLMKLLLKYYSPDSGSVIVGENDLKFLSVTEWRNKVGAVTQEGYIFDDTIENNIAVGSEYNIDYKKLQFSIRGMFYITAKHA